MFNISTYYLKEIGCKTPGSEARFRLGRGFQILPGRKEIFTIFAYVVPALYIYILFVIKEYQFTFFSTGSQLTEFNLGNTGSQNPRWIIIIFFFLLLMGGWLPVFPILIICISR